MNWFFIGLMALLLMAVWMMMPRPIEGWADPANIEMLDAVVWIMIVLSAAWVVWWWAATR